MLTIAVNPKEYYEQFKDKGINKKHEGIGKNTPWIEFINYVDRIFSLIDHEELHGTPSQKQIQKRLQVK